MKKPLIYTLALALALSLTACGQPKTEHPTEPAPSASVTEPIAAAELVQDITPEPEPEPAPAAPVETEDTQPPEAEEVQLFTDVDETVYATGTVNIRASYSTDSEKLGSLNKSDSVTRTGTSIAGTEAEGWSRVQLSDGSTAYISNKYLSTTKPVVQQQQSSGGGQQQTQQPTQSSSQQQPQPSGGQSQEDKNKADNEAAGQGLAGMYAWATEHNTGENHPELRPGAIVDENGNITNPNTAVNAQ